MMTTGLWDVPSLIREVERRDDRIDRLKADNAELKQKIERTILLINNAMTVLADYPEVQK